MGGLSRGKPRSRPLEASRQDTHQEEPSFLISRMAGWGTLHRPRQFHPWIQPGPKGGHGFKPAHPEPDRTPGPGTRAGKKPGVETGRIFT